MYSNLLWIFLAQIIVYQHVGSLIVAIGILFFILSLVSERIVSLIKFHVPFLRKKSFSLSIEKERQQWIFWVTFFCSAAVAILTKADLFMLLKNGQFLDHKIDFFDFRTLLGLLLSGLCISLGAKLWHDLVDFTANSSQYMKYKAFIKTQSYKDQLLEASHTRKNEILEKVILVTPKLQRIDGYSGFKVVSYEDGRTLAQLFFEKRVPPYSELEWISESLKEEIEVLIKPETIL